MADPACLTPFPTARYPAHSPKWQARERHHFGPTSRGGNVTISGQHRVAGTSPFRANNAIGNITISGRHCAIGNVTILDPAPEQDLQKLQRMQNRAGRLLLGAPHRTPSAEVRNRLGWKDPTSVAAFKNRLRRVT
ncbi:hypothetical protein Bbelb_404620 [Branchiostoma belcheri]|nr:hypothetical protein Bbelb_404620 [Branchiostoma belcheri]